MQFFIAKLSFIDTTLLSTPEQTRFKIPPKKKRKIAVDDEKIHSQMQEAFSILKKIPAKSQKDDCDLYCESSKLRKLDERTRDIVMNSIDNIVFQAKIAHSSNIDQQSLISRVAVPYQQLPQPQVCSTPESESDEATVRTLRKF